MSPVKISPRWKSQPLFVSSTFRDMHAERDHLHRVVFPALEEWLRERRILLEPLDLRWGVETSGEAEAEAKEQLVLKVCLDGINECRPFLIVLLGDRYGWQPPAERLAITAGEYGFVPDAVAGMSVTALEIEAGLLASEDQAVRSFVYLREPLPLDDMPDDLRAVYSDAAAGNEDAAGRLEMLKERLRNVPRLEGRVRDYTLEWDAYACAPDAESLNAWGEQVLADLKAELSGDVEAHGLDEAPELTWQEEEAFEYEAFVEQRARVFVGRSDTIAEIEAWAFSADEGSAPWGLVYTGASGAGKSALMAELYRRWTHEPQDPSDDRAPVVLAHAAGISRRSGWVTPMLQRWIGELAALIGINDPLAEHDKHETVVEAFRDLVTRIAQDRRVILLVDAINQFDSGAWQDQSWVPAGCPSIRLLATAIQGDASERLLGAHEAIEARELPALTAAEAGDIAVAQCARYRKTLSDSVLAALKEHPSAGNALWLRMAIDALLQLDADDFENAQADHADQPADRQIPAFMTALVREAFPPDVAGMYAYLLTRLEARFGEAPVRTFALALALSRSGWRDTDLRELAPRLGGGEWDDATGAILRRAFRLHLSRHGDPACWDFFHILAREAVLARYAGSGDERSSLHAAIADHLAALPDDDPIAQRESMHHLLEAEDMVGAAEFLAQAPDGLARDAAVLSLAERVLKREKENKRDHSLGLIDGLLEHANIEKLDLPSRLMIDVFAQVSGRVSGRTALNFMETIHGWYIENRTYLSPDQFLVDLSISHDTLGEIENAEGRGNSARSHFSAAMEIRRALHDRLNNTAYAANLGISHGKIGDLEGAAGNSEAAIMHYESALAVFDNLSCRVEQMEFKRNKGIIHKRIGDIERKLGNIDAARLHYINTITIIDALHKHTRNVETALDLSACHARIAALERADGNVVAARSHFESGMEIVREIHVRTGSWETAKHLAYRHVSIGELEYDAGNIEIARSHFVASMEIRKILHDRIGNADTALDFAVSAARLGEIELSAGNIKMARELFELTVCIRETFKDLINNIETATDLAIGLNWLGHLELSEHNYEAARQHFEAAMEISKALHDRVGSPETARSLAIAHSNVGELKLAVEDVDAARLHFESAIGITKILHDGVGSVATARDLSVSHGKLGDLLCAMEDFDKGRTHYVAALDIRKSLYDGNVVSRTLIDLAVSYQRLGRLEQLAGNIDKARSNLMTSMQLKKDRHEQIKSIQTAQDLIMNHIMIADIEQSQGNTEAAKDQYNSILEIQKKLSE
ncbi:tetratricopeptide repeat protein [Alkalicaulis satelles]|uniref:Tetratricopeptide repeat protein n=1 Tax=Alkalicaulis satelles TaxID=2609175 RepID=A0A5M6ZFN8_9PROT|nr:tetratricopeptide repeat protein [Alkalicaulis satelles]KAA5803572.1 tetratricopeptide repeat protein [Alkalicaulis satelles]